MTRLFLIRHGNTADEETKKVYKGRTDIPLSPKGIARMEKAARFLSAFKLDRIYTSTLSRSVDSGRIIARAQGLDARVLPAFDEVDFGAWEGLSFDEIKQRYPEDFARWLVDPGNHPPPRGESFRKARKRSMDQLKKILGEDEGLTIGIVAHAGILRIMIFSLLGMRLSRLFRIGQDYGCINIVDIYEDRMPVVNLLNFTYYQSP
jgi:alpha-ribazole phosphatase/probable phosphoglycerate mutase